MAIVTNVLTTEVEGAWRRLRLLSRDGTVAGLADTTRDDLLAVGLHLHDIGLLLSLQSWWEAQVPPAVALVMWRARTMQSSDGSLKRTMTADMPETNIAVRFIQLSLALGGAA